ncbi:MAG: HAMP domain-containing histidine kinase [Faecalibacterium sp.]|jgi:signal transduction histidine kinase|nr:HAMP domain-containing histidine kinase [Faecalibacterium sp.]
MSISKEAAKAPKTEPKKRSAYSSAALHRTLSIRGQLMLFLCFMCLFLLVLVWVLSSRLLQPRYNAYIYDKLSARLDTIVSMMNEAIDNGEEISSRDFWTLNVNSDFLDDMNAAVRDGTLNVTGCCVDISDTTMRSVIYIENVHPCLLHNSTGSMFGGNGEGPASNRDTEDVIRLRRACFSAAQLYRVLRTSSGTSQMVVGRTTSDGKYCVLVSASIAQVDEAGVVLKMLLPGIAAILFLIALVAAWLFSRWFTKPLTQLSAAANKMAEGNYDVHVPVARNDELGMLSEDFNHMAGEVKRSAQLQRDLLANVSHDLRTPLTLIKGYAETVRDITGADKPKRDEQMNIIIDETDRLSALVNSVMELSKVSSGAEKCEPVRFDIAQLCDEVADRYTAVCAQNGWKLALDIPTDHALNVWADPAMMERVLHNLLGNAMHHIGPDGIFVLRAKDIGGGSVRLEVEDHGAGIRPEDLPHLFDRYYRSRSDAGKAGTGLGLSITKAIFQQHGARFGVESIPGKGSTFWFILQDKMSGPEKT